MNRKKIATLAAAVLLAGGIWACDGPESMVDAGHRMLDAMSGDAEAQDGGGDTGPTRVEVDCEVVETRPGTDRTSGAAVEGRVWAAALENPAISPGNTRIEAQLCDRVSRPRPPMAECPDGADCEVPESWLEWPACMSSEVEVDAGVARVICGRDSVPEDINDARWGRVVFWVH